MRAIDADALKEDLTRFYDNEVTARKLIDEQPTIQPEIVRCKDCKHAEYIDDVQTLWCTECGQGRTVAPMIFAVMQRGEPMDDLISRQAAINAIDECYCGGEDSCGEPWIYKENAVEAINMIEPLSSAEPKRGKWAITNLGVLGAFDCCSECGRVVSHKEPLYNFCPNCGAKMEVNHESN